MKRKNIRQRKSFRQPELTAKPMAEVELPGMPEKPKNVEPKISSTAMEIVSEAAALCAGDPKVLKAFFEQLAEQYPESGQPISLISIMPAGEKGIDVNFKLLPSVSPGEDRALIHQLGIRAMEAISFTKKKENDHA